MKKYKIDALVDYVMGHLRYGSYQGIIELDENRLDDDDYVYKMIRKHCDFNIEDYSIEENNIFLIIKKVGTIKKTLKELSSLIKQKMNMLYLIIFL